LQFEASKSCEHQNGGGGHRQENAGRRPKLNDLFCRTSTETMGSRFSRATGNKRRERTAGVASLDGASFPE